MIKMSLMSYRLPLVLLAGLFLSTPIIAEKPDGFGKDKTTNKVKNTKVGTMMAETASMVGVAV